MPYKRNSHNPNSSSARSGIVVGFLGSMALVGALLVFMYAVTFVPETTSIILSAVVMLAIGVFFAYILVGVVFKPFTFQRFGESVLWSAFAVAIIWLVNKTVPFTLGVTVIDVRLFSILMGVAEEAFFRLFLCNFIFRVTKSQMFAIVISGWVWAIYHIARYGGNMASMFVILAAGMGLGWVMLQSKMGDGVMFAHGVVNYLATS